MGTSLVSVRCPWCLADDDRVVDSRVAEDGSGHPSSPRVLGLRPPVHHLRAHRRDPAHRRQALRHPPALRPGQAHRRPAGRHEEPAGHRGPARRRRPGGGGRAPGGGLGGDLRAGGPGRARAPARRRRGGLPPVRQRLQGLRGRRRLPSGGGPPHQDHRAEASRGLTVAELLTEVPRRRPGHLRPPGRSRRLLRRHPGGMGRRRVRGPHPDLHRRRQGHGRPGDATRPNSCGTVPPRRPSAAAVLGSGRPGAPGLSGRGARPTTRPSGGRWWRWSAACVPTPCCAPIRPRSSSGRTTSTTGTTGSPGSPRSTPWRPAAAMPHYFPDAGPAHQVSTVLLSGTLEPDVWVDISTTVDRKGEAVACHRSQFPDGGGVGGHGRPAGRGGRRSPGRRAVRRGVPETAPRRVTGVPRRGSGRRPRAVRRPGRPGDPARRHGLVLRLRRGAGRSVAGRSAGHRRRERGRGVVAACTYEARHVRGPLGHAVVGGPAAVPRRGLPGRPVPPLRRGEPATPRHPGVVHAAGRGDLARRGVPRRERGGAPVRCRDEHGPRDPGPGARRR